MVVGLIHEENGGKLCTLLLTIKSTIPKHALSRRKSKKGIRRVIQRVGRSRIEEKKVENT